MNGTLTFELPRRRWCDATGAVLVSVTFVRSLVDFRQHNDATLSEHVRSSVECDVCRAYVQDIFNVSQRVAIFQRARVWKMSTSWKQITLHMTEKQLTITGAKCRAWWAIVVSSWNIMHMSWVHILSLELAVLVRRARAMPICYINF